MGGTGKAPYQPEPFRHLRLRPLHSDGESGKEGMKCLNLCLRPICLGEHGHSDHYLDVPWVS